MCDKQSMPDVTDSQHREQMLILRAELLSAEEDRLAEKKGCTTDELDMYLDSIIAEI